MLRIASLLMDVSSEMINALLPLYLAGGLGASAREASGPASLTLAAE
ncbi:hypothetical protein [Paracoccus sp. (in: a-proteobacteria)]|nr:hypothetical protein [Paracoccus sp. (in: a-proteobacteria)]